MAEYFELVADEDGGYVKVKLDAKLISALLLEINIGGVMDSVATDRKVKLKHEHMQVINSSTFKASPAIEAKRAVQRIHALRQLQADLPSVVVTGRPTIKYGPHTYTRARALSLSLSLFLLPPCRQSGVRLQTQHGGVCLRPL